MLQKTISPVDGSVVAEVMLATPAEIEATLTAAVRAQREWKLFPYTTLFRSRKSVV